MLRSHFNVTFCKWQETSSLSETCGLSDDHNVPKYNGNEMTKQNASVGGTAVFVILLLLSNSFTKYELNIFYLKSVGSEYYCPQIHYCN